MKVHSIFVCMVMWSNLQCVTIHYEISTHQNKRPYQEDRFAYKKLTTGEFFGIYDGHGGSHVSSFLQETLANCFAQCLISKSAEKAFEGSFEKAEHKVLQNFKDGATALVIYVDEDNCMHCAWTGDTRAVLEENGGVGFETKDHKPDDSVERTRIENAGGTIKKYGVWRVGGLAISRSIGDKEVKKQCPGQVIAIPEYKSMSLTADNHFLIMASDGLWDVMTSKEAINFVKKILSNGRHMAFAQSLQNEAIVRGSSDNITVCVLLFDWKENAVKKSSSSVITRFWNWIQTIF